MEFLDDVSFNSILTCLSIFYFSWCSSVPRYLFDCLNNRVFLSSNYQLIVAPQIFDVVETSIG